MRRTLLVIARTCLVLAALLTVSASAFAQGGSTASSLSGVVVDDTGGVMPGVDIVAKNSATGAVSTAVSDGEGRFTIPALEPGTYSVTIALSGFKTVVLADVKLITATPASVKVRLEVGGLEETVTVTGGADIVQTQTATVATTLTTTQMTKLPLATRNSMDFLTALPGVDTTGAVRNSTVMGLRQSSTNITIDGINVQDNYLKSSDGFFARISPRLDAIEEVTVSTANPGAESAGQGAVQVRFTTRSGTNTYTGSAYWFLRRPEFNTTYWFNKRDDLPKDQVKVDTYGFRAGGPIMVPGMFDGHDKAFFFFNYEEMRQPGEQGRNRTILSPAAQAGTFTYSGGSVNLLALAAANGQTSTLDPTTSKLLADIAASTLETGTISALTDPNLQRFSFINAYDSIRRFPTTRVDVNLAKNHRVGVSYYAQQYNTSPDALNGYDPAFPGFSNTGDQYSLRWSLTGNLRSTLSPRMVNELRAGGTGGPIQFGKGITAAQFADMQNFGLGISAAGITNAYVARNPYSRDVPTYMVEDTLNWLKGSHSISLGGNFTQINYLYDGGNLVPTITFGVNSADPADAMFNVTNFPGASGTDLANARGIYAVLTGRVTAINAAAVLDGSTGKYVYMGRAARESRMRETGIFIQDSWKIRQGLTVNAGLRHELQLPFVPLDNYYSMAITPDMLYGVSGPGNMFKPGVMTGQPTQFVSYKKGTKAFNTDWNNVAPSAGIAWTPGTKSGVLGALMGKEGDFVLRGGYSMSYNREGMSTFDNIFSYNPGGSIDATRSMSIGNLVPSGGSLPLLLRSGNLGAPVFQDAPNYPLTPGITESVNVFDPNTTVPYAHSWTMGFQRAVSKDMAVEVRYVGTRGRNGWADGGRDYNEINISENGFLNEFRLAQANLQANIAAGRGNTFAYTGAPGTSPLPIFAAAFNGVTAANAGNTALYTGTSWTNSTFLGWLAMNNPQPVSTTSGGSGFASTGSNGLIGNATFRNNLLNAGYPANLFVVNPGMIGGAWMTTNGQLSSNYDAMQLELRRRMSKGLLFSANYTFASATLSSFFSHRYDMDMVTSGSTLRHAFKLNWVYELPFGQGRRFGNGVGKLANAFIGGWDFSGNARIQSGQVFDYGNRTLVGMTDKDLQEMFKVYKVPDASGKVRIYMLPQDVIDNTIKAFSTSATSPTGYGSLGAPAGRYIAPANSASCVQAVAGDCAPRHHYVTGPLFQRYDMSLAKRVAVAGRSYATFTLDVLNVFDNVNFTPNSTTPQGVYSGATPANYEVTSAWRDISNTQDPGGRVMQLSFRFSF